jgi:PKD repeat protein
VSAKAHGIYSVTYTAANSLGTASQAFTLRVDQAPAFTGGTKFTETAGTPFSVAVKTTGYPAARLTAGKLAKGLKLVSLGNGAGEVSGTAKVKRGTYRVAITATNAGGHHSETLTLAVKAAGKKKKERVPGFTSAGSARAKAGHAFSFKVKTAGSPTKYASNLSESGTLPGGVRFKNNHNGTATLSGTPAATSGGAYVVTLTAKDGDGTTTQAFVLTVTGAPAVTTSSSIRASVGNALSFTVRAAAAPAAALTVSRGLPAGLIWVDNGNSTATLAGVPAKAGTYLIPIKIKNALGSIVEILTVRVK